MDRVEFLLLVIYTLYVIAPLVRDELALRALLMIASVGFVIWGYAVEERVTVVANVVFILVSLRHVIRILRYRQPVDLSPDQARVYEGLFSAMSRREFLDLWNLGDGSTAPAGDLILKGDEIDFVLVVLDQDVAIELDTGDRIASAPSLLGEMSYALGESAAATATVRLDTDAKVHRWSKSTLRDLEQNHPQLANPFLAALGRNLARKIRL